ncbi:hypothetical protein GCM10025868_17480 [Angustibacter aerolatus]|uniref:Uncharacterized protein n=1 Tax=Angustibacter aerolatus TaxID=1162965 RepID=A0ABQ6JE82_9ACTN|nr:hypothetical protein GCM10025868_17480 [Angustibacter aerolatus]
MAERPGVAAVHQALVDLAPHVVPGCDHASLMLAKGSGYVTAASSDPTGALVDRLERECGEGPCVDAIREVAYERPRTSPRSAAGRASPSACCRSHRCAAWPATGSSSRTARSVR